MYFLSISEKSENFSSLSTGREKLIDLSNKLQDELLKGITDITVIQYRTENNDAKSSKRQNQMTTEVMNALYAKKKTFRKDSKLFRLCETERAQLFLCAAKFNMDAVFAKVSIFDKLDGLFADDIMSHRQCMNR